MPSRSTTSTRGWTGLGDLAGVDAPDGRRARRHRSRSQDPPPQAPQVFPLIDNQTVGHLDRRAPWSTIHDDLTDSGAGSVEVGNLRGEPARGPAWSTADPASAARHPAVDTRNSSMGCRSGARRGAAQVAQPSSRVAARRSHLPTHRGRPHGPWDGTRASRNRHGVPRRRRRNVVAEPGVGSSGMVRGIAAPSHIGTRRSDGSTPCTAPQVLLTHLACGRHAHAQLDFGARVLIIPAATLVSRAETPSSRAASATRMRSAFMTPLLNAREPTTEVVDQRLQLGQHGQVVRGLSQGVGSVLRHLEPLHRQLEGQQISSGGLSGASKISQMVCPCPRNVHERVKRGRTRQH